MIYQFNQITLDTAQYRLCMAGSPISVEPQVFDLLAYLLENRNRVVTRGELLENLWKDKVVTDSALGARIKDARKAVGDSGDRQEVIRTFHGRGYQFVSPVTQINAETEKVELTNSDLNKTNQVITATPSIAVLPFTNMSGDPEQEYFTDGLVDDIITTLSKLSGLLVIARDSCFVYKDRKTDVRQVARELGVQYVLEGSVRKVGKRVRINVRFTDAKVGVNIWAQRYDRDIGDIFAVQDEVTLALATEMQVQFLEGEQARLQYSTTQNVEAWTNWVKGLSYYREVSREQTEHARECWETAIALDPESASLNAMLGLLHCVNARFGWCYDRETAMLKSSAYIEKAIKLDSNNAEAHRASSVHLVLKNCHDEAVTEMRKAESLSPSSADIAATASYIYSCSGLAEEAVIAIERAIRSHPNHPPYYFGHLGNAYRIAGRFDEAITAFNAFDELSPGCGLVDLVLINRQLDRHEEAIFEATWLLAVKPEFTVRAWIDTQFLKDPAQLESEISALTESGLPLDK